MKRNSGSCHGGVFFLLLGPKEVVVACESWWAGRQSWGEWSRGNRCGILIFSQGPGSFRGWRREVEAERQRLPWADGRALFWTLHFSQKVAPLHSPPSDLPEGRRKAERAVASSWCGMRAVGCPASLILKEIQDGSTYHNQQWWRESPRIGPST